MSDLQDLGDYRRGAQQSWEHSMTMLRAVLDGSTYESVAAQYAISRTAVERRIKFVAQHVAAAARIDGLNEAGAALVYRLRRHRQALLTALDEFEGQVPMAPRNVRILSEEDIVAGAQRIRSRSRQPLEDLALYYVLMATGARPLEIVRLEVLDYLNPDGTVRQSSQMRKECSITGKARPIFFNSARLDDAMTAYLANRLLRGHGVGSPDRYRGLDPVSRLFVSPTGTGFEIQQYGAEGQLRFRCRAIQESYRRLFRHAGLKQVTALAVRYTMAERLYRRGADELQVGLLLGISERNAVCSKFPRRQPTMDELTTDLV